MARLAKNIGRNVGINLDLMDLRKAGATEQKYEFVNATQKKYVVKMHDGTFYRPKGSS